MDSGRGFGAEAEFMRHVIHPAVERPLPLLGSQEEEEPL
jgi:hypothetical protein